MSTRITESQARSLGIDLAPGQRKRSRGSVPTSKPAPIFEALCAAHGIFEPVEEYRFHPLRKWRLDYAWPEKLIALEVEGGIYGHGKRCPTCKRRAPGAHSGIANIQRDIAKYNAATEMNWKVFRCQPEDIESGEVFQMLRRVLGMNR